MWVGSDLLSPAEALARLRPQISNLDQFLNKRQIELIPHADWYVDGGRINLGGLPGRFQEKLDAARDRGFAGLRITGGGDPRLRRQAHEYEKGLSSAIRPHPAMVLCTYPLAGTSAAELLDASRAHRFTAVIWEGAVAILDTPTLRQTKGEMISLNLAEHLRILRAKNQGLSEQIIEHKQVEDELRRQKEILQTIFDHIPVMINLLGPGDRILLVNREWERTMGWTLEELRKHKLDVIALCYPDPDESRRARDFISNSNGQWEDFVTHVRDGRVLNTTWAMIHLSDGTTLGIGQDTTGRKKVEERLRTSTQQLRALSARMEEAREEERNRVARTVHDELGSVLTSLKWDLAGLEKSFSASADPGDLAALRTKVEDMLMLVDACIQSVRRVASELRPSILDLGLVEAIEWQTQQFEARTGIVCSRDGFSYTIRLNDQQATAIFRIFQEALTNILRHASATRVDITMALEPSEFVLTIHDNGRGVIGIEKSGLGILGMQERARLIGGIMDINGIEGRGTKISVRVPIPARVSAQ